MDWNYPVPLPKLKLAHGRCSEQVFGRLKAYKHLDLPPFRHPRSCKSSNVYLPYMRPHGSRPSHHIHHACLFQLMSYSHPNPTIPCNPTPQSEFPIVLRHHSSLLSTISLPSSPNHPISSTHLWRLAHRLNHLLQQLDPRLLPALALANTYILQHRRVSDKGRVGVALDVGRPFVFCCVGRAGADVARLQGFELLLGAEFVCHCLGGRCVGEFAGRALRGRLEWWCGR
jgi:hypothetical protein